MTAVREATSLLIDVSELLEQPGTQRRFELSGEVSGLELDMVAVAGGHLDIDALAESLVEGIQLSGRVSGRLELRCRRCLDDVRRPFSFALRELFAAGPADEEAYPIEDGLIDLEPMLRDAVLLELPLNPVCREACRGLCAQCGQNLNQADCGHRAEEIDARWEPLRRFLEMGE